MGLDELDVMIDAMPDATMILADASDWFAWFAPSPPKGAEVVSGGRIIYRGLPVWVIMPGETRVLTAAEASAAGYDAPEMTNSATGQSLKT